jgi:hypothetical protein
VTDAEKYGAIPAETRITMLMNLEHIIELNSQKTALLLQMKAALMHQWEKNMDTATITSKTFKDLVNKYYDAVEAGKGIFMWEDHQILVTYAKYLIEYLEPQIVARSDDFLGASSFIAKRRRLHRKWKQDKEEAGA